MELIDNTFPNLLRYLKIHGTHDKIYTYDNKKTCLANKNVYICGGCELSYIYDYLKSITNNAYHTFESKTSMDIFSELHNNNTFIYDFKADFYILSIIQLFKSLLVRYQHKKYFELPTMFLTDIKEMFDNLDYSIKKIRTFSNNPIWLTTMCYISNETLFGHNEFLINDSSFSFVEMIKYFELQIYDVSKKNDNIYILNIDAITEKYNKYDCIKPYQGYPYGHLTYLGSALVAEAFYNQLSYLDNNINRIKCVVMDLDNTLWDGILIEDSKVKVNQQICNILYGLAQRGIVLALCSKNEPSMKDKIFDIIKNDLYGKHIVKYICSWRINWKPKSVNILDIAKELNIGVNTIAFFDDSEFERREVKTNAPNIFVYSNTDIYNILNDPKFNPIRGIISSSTEKRLSTYIANKDRKIELNNFIKLENDPFIKFMISSEFQLDIDFAKKNDLNRVFEVIQRTNQMNATLNRTNLEDIQEYFNDSNYIIYSLSLKDKYGDYGNVGTVIIKLNNDVANILEFAISCRAMGKMVEDAVIINIIKYLQSININILTIKLIETEKNKSFIEIFKKYDFVCTNDSTYEHKIMDNNYTYPIWF